MTAASWEDWSMVADTFLANARAAACANEMRTAYANVFRGLDILLLAAQWKKIRSDLEEICSEKYPVAFGIGAVRFVSDAASLVPDWESLIKKLATTATNQNVDAAKAMRGLLT